MRTWIIILALALPALAFKLENSSSSNDKAEILYQQIEWLSETDLTGSLKMVDEALSVYADNSRLASLKKELIIKDYKKNYLTDTLGPESGLFVKKPANCYEGKLSDKSLKVVLNRINYFRRLAGVYDSCSFDPTLNENAQKAAYMMDVNDRIDHHPSSSWKCYSKEGGQTAGNSNLSLGYGFLKALKGQMDDAGAPNDACGHRRWILNPYNSRFGFGSTLNAMCLNVLNTDPKGKYTVKFKDTQSVCWPAKDYFPFDLVPQRWSFSLADADFKIASVTVRVNGVKQSLAKEKVYIGYALNTLVWKMTGAIRSDVVYEVTITNVKQYGKAKTYTYKVIPIIIS